MIKLSSEADQVCVAKANEAGQAHIFDAWDDLSPDDQLQLISQLQPLDFQLIRRLIHQLQSGACEPNENLIPKPPKIDLLPPEGSTEIAALRSSGEEALAAGKVGLVMLAGGSSRMPASESVGFVPVGPVSGKTIFQLQAEKVRALNLRHKVSLRWWLVTHPRERARIAEFFRASSCFGLSSNDTVLVDQPLLPVVNRRGKFLLSEPGHVAMEPVGHGGGLFDFLQRERLDELEKRGIEHLFFFQADNPLVSIADPVFLGHHILNGIEVSSKAVRKSHPDEEVGVFCDLGGAPGVIEYSELKNEYREQYAANGGPTFCHGNAAIHVIRVDFFRRMVDENIQLPFHVRELETPCLDRRGKRVCPREPNCTQFRFFLFDAMRVARHTSIIECRREAEFSPIRNVSGEKSPHSAARNLSDLYASWLERAGATFVNSSAEQRRHAIEISPLFALDENELRSKIDLPMEIDGDFCLEAGGRA